MKEDMNECVNKKDGQTSFLKEFILKIVKYFVDVIEFAHRHLVAVLLFRLLVSTGDKNNNHSSKSQGQHFVNLIQRCAADLWPSIFSRVQV